MYFKQAVRSPAQRFGDDHNGVANDIEGRELNHTALDGVAVQPKHLPQEAIQV